jgi:hypothetical protein
MSIIKVLIILSFALISNVVSAQKGEQIYISGYQGQSYLFFDSVSRILSLDTIGISGKYYLYASFELDEYLHIKKLEVNDLAIKKCPPSLLMYANLVLSQTNGKWVIPTGSFFRQGLDKIYVLFIFIEYRNQSRVIIQDEDRQIARYHLSRNTGKVIDGYYQSKIKFVTAIRYPN